MSINLDKAKTWLRVDGTYEDDLIKDLIKEAVSELESSGVKERAEADGDYPLYSKAIKYIVIRDYEARGVEEIEDKVLQSFILKLKDW